ncbi:MAG: DUF4340 domain-containing protein [Lachnoclostridium sp.]|jgi:hypothetical protein
MAGSKKKKQSLTLVLLLIALIVLIGACFWLLKYNEKKDSKKDESDSETILKLDEDSIEKIYFKNKDTEMTLVKGDDDKWIYTDDKSFPVNQTYADNMSKAFTKLTSTRTLEEGVDNLSDFGLDDPAILVVVTDKDGNETKLCIGSEVPVTGGYYATVNDDGKVYVISSSVYDNFDHDKIEMTEVESLPTITSSNITHLLVEKKDEPNFEIQYDESDNANATSEFAGISNWTLKQPYKTPITAESSEVTTLLKNYSELSFTSCVDYNAKDLSKYGLDDPAARVYLEYYEIYTKESDSSEDDTKDSTDTTDTEDDTTRVDYTLELLIGNKTEDGDYYAKTSDSNAVHIMSASTVENIINIDAFSIASHYLSLVKIDSVDKVDINVEGKTYTLSIDRTEKTSDEQTDESSDDSDEQTETYYFNGKEVKESPFKKLYQTIITPTAEREIPEEYFNNNKEQAPYMTLTFYLTNGDTVKISYKPYDDSYFVANTNGIEYFLTDLRQVKDITNALESFTGKEK